MATRGLRVSLVLVNNQIKTLARGNMRTTFVPKRQCCYSDTGAVLPKPEIARLGSIRALGTAIPFLLLGAYISMEFATLLEEHDLFVPDDDDDD